MASFRLLINVCIPLAGVIVAALAAVWIFRDLEWTKFTSTVANAEIFWIPFLAATILIEQWFRAWKWRQILFDLKPIGTGRLYGAILAGYAATILVPLGISPFVRSWIVARLEALKMVTVLATAAIERFVDGVVFALIALVVAIGSSVALENPTLKLGLVSGAAISIAIFGGALWILFKGRQRLARDEALVARILDKLSSLSRRHLGDLRASLEMGIVWPRDWRRRIGVVVASLAMKAVAASHFYWAGLSVGVALSFMDYLFLLVMAGFALVLARFVRVPAGFVIGSGYALSLLEVPHEQALAMVLFNHVLSVLLTVGIGATVLMSSGIKIRNLMRARESL